jgi:hypothetical protein
MPFDLPTILSLGSRALKVAGTTLRLFKGWNRPEVIVGREDVMAANLKMLERFATKNESTIWSTRVTYWDLSENSDLRLKFRHLLTQSIHKGFNVKRIWRITSANDVARFLEYWDDYQKYDGYNVSVIVDTKAFIPELLGIDDTCASISMPGPSSPTKICSSVLFRDSEGATALHRYFEVLWAEALSIKSGKNVNNENLKYLRNLHNDANHTNS